MPDPGARSFHVVGGMVLVAATAAGLGVGRSLGLTYEYEYAYYQFFTQYGETPDRNCLAVAPAVVAVWLVLVLGGRSEPEPTWVDRAGRVVGALWVGSALVLNVLNDFV